METETNRRVTTNHLINSPAQPEKPLLGIHYMCRPELTAYWKGFCLFLDGDGDESKAGLKWIFKTNRKQALCGWVKPQLEKALPL